MGFRYSGTAWDGQEIVCSDAIRQLGLEVSALPGRPTSSDGTVASQGHDRSSPTSDHTPKPATGLGVVRAIDITVTGAQGSAVTETLRTSRDPRINGPVAGGGGPPAADLLPRAEATHRGM